MVSNLEWFLKCILMKMKNWRWAHHRVISAEIVTRFITLNNSKCLMKYYFFAYYKCYRSYRCYLVKQRNATPKAAQWIYAILTSLFAMKYECFSNLCLLPWLHLKINFMREWINQSEYIIYLLLWMNLKAVHHFK